MPSVQVFQDGQLIGVEQIAATVPVVRTPLQIDELLTDAEEAAIHSVIESASPYAQAVRRLWRRLGIAQEIASDDPRTIEGCTAAVQLGLLTADRVRVIFGVEVANA